MKIVHKVKNGLCIGALETITDSLLKESKYTELKNITKCDKMSGQVDMGASIQAHTCSLWCLETV